MESWHQDFRVGEWRVSPKLNRISNSGQSTQLKHKSMQVLVCLADAGGDVVSRNDVMDVVWPGMTVTDDVLTQSIVELRRAFGDDAKHPKYIETIPKIGFRLVAQVAPVESEEADVDPQRRYQPRFLIASLVVIIALAWVVSTVDNDDARDPVIEVEPPPSLAVLPFVNLTMDPAQTWLSDGISVEILNDLGEIPGLRLVGRKSSFRFRGDDLDLREVGSVLGVTILLEGTVRREGDNLRVTAQLVSVADGFQIWSESYDLTLDDVLQTQDDIAVAVVEALRPQLGLAEGITQPARIQVTSEAYAEYLQGLFFIDRIFAPGQRDTNIDAPQIALEHMQRATELAPNFAMAWAGRVRAQNWLTNLTGGSWADVEPTVDEWMIRALELGDDIAEVHFAAGTWYEGDRAVPHLRRAVEINPNYAEAYATLAMNSESSGRYGEYFEFASKAAALDPLDNWANWIAFYADFHQGQHDELEDLIRDNRQQWPTANALADEVHLRFELGQFEHWPALHERADMLGPEWGVEPPNWISGPPRYFGDGYLVLGMVEPARRFLGGLYEDVIDLYNGDASSAIEYLSAELEESRGAAVGYDRTFVDVLSSLIEAHLYAGSYAEIVKTMDDQGIGTDLFGLPYPERTNPPWPQVAYTYAQFQLGNNDLGNQWLDAIAGRLEDRISQGVRLPNHYYELARVRAMQGRTADSLDALQQAIDMGWRRWYFDRDPVLEPVRQLPEFAELQTRYDADLLHKRNLVLQQQSNQAN